MDVWEERKKNAKYLSDSLKLLAVSLLLNNPRKRTQHTFERWVIIKSASVTCEATTRK